jgi:DNA-binding IclR family transcriptional regulator
MSSTQANAAAVRAFRIIEIISEAHEPLSLAQISERIDLPKQSVHRLLKQLESAWLVTRNGPGKQYECSSRVRKMAVSMLMVSGPAAARRAILQQLADAVDETCNLTMSSGEGIVYLDRVEANWPLPTTLHAGTRVPLHCTSSGKLLMSFMPRQQRERRIRREKLSFNNQEYMPGIVAMAVPVMLDSRRACAAVAIQSSAERITTQGLQAYLPQLRQAAEKMAGTFREGSARL